MEYKANIGIRILVMNQQYAENLYGYEAPLTEEYKPLSLLHVGHEQEVHAKF